MFRILCINPGSTSTKVGIFEDATPLLKETVAHSAQQLSKYESSLEQLNMRKKDIERFIEDSGFSIKEFDAFSARGGILPPLESGTYAVNESMSEFLLNLAKVDHPSNLAALIARDFSKDTSKPCFVTDPISVDEFEPLARISGLPELPRKSLLHALNMKAVARKIALEIGKDYNECNFVIAHLGGGISVGAQKKGRMIDVNNANEEGPFSPERTGELPCGDVVSMAFSGKYTTKEMKALFTKKGGLVAYLGTNDLRTALEKGEEDSSAIKVVEAMAYQIAKEIGGMCAVLKGDVDAIILTGGMANNLNFLEIIKTYISHFGLIAVVPGENELEALAEGALRILKKEEELKVFEFKAGARW